MYHALRRFDRNLPATDLLIRVERHLHFVGKQMVIDRLFRPLTHPVARTTRNQGSTKKRENYTEGS